MTIRRINKSVNRSKLILGDIHKGIGLHVVRTSGVIVVSVEILHVLSEYPTTVGLLCQRIVGLAVFRFELVKCEPV